MKKIFITLGTPGAGKTTFIEKASLDIFGDNRIELATLSPDAIRAMYQTPVAKPDGGFGIAGGHEKRVWEIIREIIKGKVYRGEMIIVDATHSRNTAISAYKQYHDEGYEVIAIDFREYASLDEIHRRNSSRGRYKSVPVDVIDTIHARLETLDVPKWVRVIEPTEFKDEFKSLHHNFDDFNSLTVFGDIHGCMNEFQLMLDSFAFDYQKKNTKDGLIFVGDYFDRGYDVVGVFKKLQELEENYFVFKIRGNHEEPLLYYKDFMFSIAGHLKRYHDTHLYNNIVSTGHPTIDTKTFMELIQNTIPEVIWFPNSVASISNISNAVRILTDMLIEKKGNPSSIRFKFNDLWAGIFGENPQVAVMCDYLNILIHMKGTLLGYDAKGLQVWKEIEEGSYKRLDTMVEEIKKYPNLWLEFEKAVQSYNLPAELVQESDTKFHKLKRTSLDTCKEFLKSDITLSEIKAFNKSLFPMFYAKIGKTNLLVTHGGLTTVPTLITPEADMIRGIGGYEDAEETAETFMKNHPDVVQVHGHRNMSNLPIFVNNNVCNVNGDVELGLRAVSFNKDGSGESTEIGPRPETLAFHKAAQIRRSIKNSNLSPIKLGENAIELFMQHSYVEKKTLPNNVLALNFTRKAFNNGIWDDVTLQARGLFIDSETKEVIARGFNKFFNMGERNGLDQRAIRELVYPLKAYEKANGYLGLISVDSRGEIPQWFIASKSTSDGPFALHFQKMVKPFLNDKLMQKVQYENLTLVFEVIDPEFDTHMEKYDAPELILLAGIRNKLEFEQLPYETLSEYTELFNDSPDMVIRPKKLVKVCENFNDFFIFTKELNSNPPFADKGIEGIVFEEDRDIPAFFKLKTDWYSFWKFMRSVKHTLASRIRKSNLRIERGRVSGDDRKDTLSKSDRIRMKSRFHTAEEIKVFDAMLDLAQEDFANFEKMDIIQVREKILPRIKGDIIEAKKDLE